MKFIFLLSFLFLFPLSCQTPTGVESDDDADTTEPVTRPAGMPTIEPVIPR
jgi:hypothetical protein